MTRGARAMTGGANAWLTVAALLGAVALGGTLLKPESIDWQPLLAWREPWRAFSAVGVHYSTQHLIVNWVGLAVVAAFGVVAQVPARVAWAWLAAWPLTQFGLLLRPDLAHYGGLSGVLHAGVAIATLWLLVAARGRRRWIGAAVGAGLIVKLLLEQPWGPALREGGGWDIAIAPLAHASGAAAGALCALLAWAWRRESRP